MSKRLFFLALLLPGVANAQSQGCYISSFLLIEPGLQPFCSFGPPISCGSSIFSNTLTHGNSVARLCDDLNETADALKSCNSANNSCKSALAVCATGSLQTCAASLSSCRAERDEYFDDAFFYQAHHKACGDTNDQIRGAIGYWEGLAHYYENLAARLRAKCGRGCRKIQ